MPVQAQVEHIPLTKRRLLEFLEGQEELVTAKVVSIDLDSRASTVTEMLERCAAQGLVEREANQRPREYRISEAGRRRLKLFRSDQANSEPQSDEPPETNADASGSESDREQIGSLDFTELRGEVTRQFEGLREDMHDLFDALSLRPSPAEGLRERAEQVKRRLESFAERVKADAQSEAIRSLYRARYELRSLGWFESKDEVRVRIVDWEGAVGKEAAEQIERLVSLEGEIRSDCDAEKLRAVLELRDALHLPGSVFGRPAKDATTAGLGFDGRPVERR